MLGQTEVPLSYIISTGLSLVGSCLKRQTWIDQLLWKVYPNQSLLLVGPSGIGKDTIINAVEKTILKSKSVRVVGGRTIEGFYKQLLDLGTPAAAYIPIKELSSFFGGKDYQSSMVQEFTDLLSTSDSKDISTKTDLTYGGPKIINQPTLTIHAGTTEEWLHKAMPDGTMEGGFLGRFLIMVEQLGTKQIPLIKHQQIDPAERELIKESSARWETFLQTCVASFKKSREMILFEEARDVYTNWYYNRFKLFSKAVLPYANRSRDTVLRLAMLCAITREHYGWIEQVDMEFAISLMGEVARQIDRVILPPTVEARAAEEVYGVLPASTMEIIQTFGRKYQLKILQNAEQLLIAQGRIELRNGKWSRKDR